MDRAKIKEKCKDMNIIEMVDFLLDEAFKVGAKAERERILKELIDKVYIFLQPESRHILLKFIEKEKRELKQKHEVKPSG